MSNGIESWCFATMLIADDGQAGAEVLQNWAWPSKDSDCDSDDNDLVAVLCHLRRR